MRPSGLGCLTCDLRRLLTVTQLFGKYTEISIFGLRYGFFKKAIQNLDLDLPTKYLDVSTWYCL